MFKPGPHPMTQVVTVSPTTAGYASDAYKPRDTRYSPMETAISEWHARAVASADAYDRGLLNVVRPPSLQLAFLTVHHEQYRPVSVDEAIAEYASLSGPEEAIPDVSEADMAPPELESSSVPVPAQTTGEQTASAPTAGVPADTAGTPVAATAE